ncbi:hypothetical protein SFRURICE_013329 [Spodoptera frugiperda]|nr:hypothetical protein SFRURICE_013329 [Spodoptera frugiperda]
MRLLYGCRLFLPLNRSNKRIHIIHTCDDMHLIPDGVGRVILCPTRESKPRPLVRQSHLRPLDQRGSLYKRIHACSIILLQERIGAMAQTEKWVHNKQVWTSQSDAARQGMLKVAR